MSQSSEPDTPTAAGIISELGQGFRFPLAFTAVEQLAQLEAAIVELNKEFKKEIDDDKTGVERNAEEQDFMALQPSEANDDSVFSVGAESQFSESTPRADGAPNLQQKLTSLCSLRDSLSSKILENGDKFFQKLQTSVGIPVYGNHPIVAILGKGMLVPMLSFYGVATKETIAAGIKPSIPAIRNTLYEMTQELFTTPAHEMTQELFTTPAGFTPVLFPDFEVDCTIPTAANMVWNVRLKLNGNIFTLLTFRVVAMTHIDFPPQLPSLGSLGPSHLNLSLQNKYIHLCFALLSKACAKDFNCLCAMSDIDVELFKLIYIHPLQLQQFSSFFKIFLTALAEPQLDSKRSYMITALHNLVSNIVDTSQTGETLAYKRLFDGDVSGSGANTFNPIMRQITQLIQILRSLGLGLELQVSLCGGRMIYKLGDVLRTRYDVFTAVSSNPAAIAALGGVINAKAIVEEMLKPLNSPSDADYTLTFAGLGALIPSLQDPGFVQTLLMFFTLCSQLGIKKTIDEFCTSHPQYAALFLRELAVIGMSLVGGDFQLSSTRSSCDALAFLDAINFEHGPQFLNDFLRQFPRDPNRPTKSSLAEFDLVPKMLSGDYIKKIAGYVFRSGYTPIAMPANIDAIADRISRYSMSTDEGFSSPVKVLFDIFFTLFSIENVTNRAFVTQKINKELKRIAICASILFFHFQELSQMPYLAGSPKRQRINELLQFQQQLLYPEGSQERRQIDTELLQFQQRLLYPEGSPQRQRINELLQFQQQLLYPEGSPQRQQIDSELLQFQQQLLYLEGSPQRREITTMLQILGNVINYGYNPGFKLLSTEIHNIMTAYASCFVQLLQLYNLDVVFYSRAPDVTLPAIGGRTEVNLTSLERTCLQMIDPAHVPAQAEGLLHGQLQNVITTGVGFLRYIQAQDIQGNPIQPDTLSILASLLQIKESIKTEDLSYKAQGRFLTSVEAFDLFLRDFVPMLVPPSPLVASLDQLLAVFRSPGLELAELMHFQPIVVIKSENLLDPVDAADLQGLKVTGEYQFGVYVILSIFGVKFKSEWSKISLFTRMLFHQLLSRGSSMRGICLTLLGVDLLKVDPSKIRVSSENFIKDQALFLTLQPCGVVLPAPLQTYYGSDKLHHGIDTYRNGLLDTREVTHSFIHPSDYNRDEDVLSFQFLNSENLRQLMACPGEAFRRLLPDGLQPRSYEFLLKRLTDKFSMLTKECDDELKSQFAEAIKEIKRQSQSKSQSKSRAKGVAASAGAAVAVFAGPSSVPRVIAEILELHGGKNTKDIRSQLKVRELDAFIDSFVSQLLGAGPDTIDLISSTGDVCFEGKEDDVSKFRELAPDQRRYWLDHLIEMIGFFKNLSISHPSPAFLELCRQNITKYSKLLFLLKKYLIPKPTQPGLEWLEATSEQLKVALASLFQPPPETQEPVARERRRRRDRAPSPSRGRGANPSEGRAPSEGRGASPSEGRAESPGRGKFEARNRSPSPGREPTIDDDNQGGGSPKASTTKSKPKTRNNNKLSKKALTRKNKHKRKQHRNRKNKKTKNTKSKSKKNVTFKRRRR